MKNKFLYGFRPPIKVTDTTRLARDDTARDMAGKRPVIAMWPVRRVPERLFLFRRKSSSFAGICALPSVFRGFIPFLYFLSPVLELHCSYRIVFRPRYTLQVMDSPPASKQKFAPGDPAALPHQTDIDRRKCHRVVPLKVIGLGLSRSGTACKQTYRHTATYNHFC